MVRLFSLICTLYFRYSLYFILVIFVILVGLFSLFSQAPSRYSLLPSHSLPFYPYLSQYLILLLYKQITDGEINI